ncbi:MAG: hypothetical protein ABI426_08005 [Flavobacterium sp.]
MRNLIIYLTVFLCTIATKMVAQETFEEKARAIAFNIEKITKEEKQNLKEEVEAVNAELNKNNITNEQADEKKLQLAQDAAAKIESRVAEEEAKLTQLVQEKVEGKIAGNEGEEKPGRHRRGLKMHTYWSKDKDTVPHSEKRTTSQFVFAAGVNNLVTDGMVAHSDFKYWGSHFYEIGWSHNTRILKDNNLLHFKYGWSVVYNNLRATNNRYFEEVGKETNLQTAGISLKESRFRNVNLVFPMYLEFDFSGNKTKNDQPFFKTHKSVRLGLGGFAGVNLKSKQILKFNDAVGNSVTQTTKGDYNVNDFVYGVGAYLGYKETSLYVKYDLNPLFKNNIVDQNNISLGIRFDLN